LPIVAIDSNAQLLAHLEERNSLGGDRYSQSGAWVTTLSRLAMLDDEATETADFDSVAASQGFRKTIEDGVYHDFRVPPGETWVQLNQLVDEVALGHGSTYLLVFFLSFRRLALFVTSRVFVAVESEVRVEDVFE
jgi:hypothetical protein